jgi:hypothetical protein
MIHIVKLYCYKHAGAPVLSDLMPCTIVDPRSIGGIKLKVFR